ncbi:hypothetical protein D4764_10G0008490 [Takifugu flavidus]|uniref:Uncharacterized protein n=1 Tax=Takifugu flavidus TaxID=433684 RepID=A0A5C6PLL9_9TELE|nr:hypothetical protein D4764_10G0008490 [Takifugu flavidus]
MAGVDGLTGDQSQEQETAGLSVQEFFQRARETGEHPEHQPALGQLQLPLPTSPPPINLSMKIHPNFHVSQLKSVSPSSLSPPSKPPPPCRLIDDRPAYRVRCL